MSTPKDLRDGIRARLVAEGVVATPLVFFSRMPSTPDRVVVVTWFPVSIDQTEGVQVRVRGAKGSTVSAEDLSQDVKDALHGLAGQQWGSTSVELLRYVSGARLGFDGSDRDEVSLNFHALTSAASTAVTHD